MSDTLMESEVLDVWQRIRTYIDLSRINSTDKANQKRELKEAMRNPKNSSKDFKNNMDTLVDNNFPSTFIENQTIRDELLKESIRVVKINGKDRYKIKSGFRSTGKRAQPGYFLRGKSEGEAIEDLRKKTEET